MITIYKNIHVTENKLPTVNELKEILRQIQEGEMDVENILIEKPQKHYEYFEIEYLFGDGFKVRAMNFNKGINVERKFEYIESIIKLYDKFL